MDGKPQYKGQREKEMKWAVFLVFIATTMVLIGVASASTLLKEQTLSDWYDAAKILLRTGTWYIHNLTVDNLNVTNMSVMNTSFYTGNITAPWFVGNWSLMGEYVPYTGATQDITTAHNINLEGDPSSALTFADELPYTVSIYQDAGSMVAEADNYTFTLNDGGNVVFNQVSGLKSQFNMTAYKKAVIASVFCNSSSLSGAVGYCTSNLFNGMPTNSFFENITVNNSISFGIREEHPTERTLMYYNSYLYDDPVSDGFRMRYVNDFLSVNNDFLIFQKTDGNDFQPDGGMAFVQTGNTNVNRTQLILYGNGTSQFNDTLVVNANLTVGKNITAQWFNGMVNDSRLMTYATWNSTNISYEGKNTSYFDRWWDVSTGSYHLSPLNATDNIDMKNVFIYGKNWKVKSFGVDVPNLAMYPDGPVGPTVEYHCSDTPRIVSNLEMDCSDGTLKYWDGWDTTDYYPIKAKYFESTVNDGTTPPFYANSNVNVTNFNADYLDGRHSSDFVEKSNTSYMLYSTWNSTNATYAGFPAYWNSSNSSYVVWSALNMTNSSYDSCLRPPINGSNTQVTYWNSSGITGSSNFLWTTTGLNMTSPVNASYGLFNGNSRILFINTYASIGLTAAPTLIEMTSSGVNISTQVNASIFNGAWNGSSGYVPYTGATQSVNLGSQTLTTMGNVGFGATPGAAKLWVNHSYDYSDLSTLTDALVVTKKYSSTSTARTASMYMQFSGAANDAFPIGAFNAYAYHDGTGKLTRTAFPGIVAGRYLTTIASDSDAATWAGGVSSDVIISDAKTGNIDNAVDYFGEGIDAEDGTVGNAYGYYQKNHVVDGGSLTNSFGIYLEEQTSGGTANWQIYSPAGNSYFGTGSIFVEGVKGNQINSTSISANYVNTSGLKVAGNVNITGNLSVKRPYWNGYDNSTQTFANVSEVQIINISNNLEYDSYGIHVEGQRNLTFDMTGDFVCILSPEFYQSTGSNKIIAFWFQKTNSTGNFNDVAWSNSRFTMANGQYLAPSITYQFDISNPATDKVRFMWYSDSTSSQIVSIAAPTGPDRPGIPGVLLNCQKVSEIT